MKSVIIYGPQGTKKSQLAREYAKRFGGRWIDGESIPSKPLEDGVVLTTNFEESARAHNAKFGTTILSVEEVSAFIVRKG